MKPTFKDPDSSRIIVYAARGTESGSNDGGGGHEIVCKGVVEITLQFEYILDAVEFLFISVDPC